jgi:hypothetical protein
VKRRFGLLIVVMTVTATCSSENSTTTASRTAEVPSASVTTPLPDSGVIDPGTYETNFQPSMAFTASSSGWEVDVDTPGWVGMEFPLSPPVVGTLGIVAVTKVLDPQHGGEPIDPPEDLAGWIAKLPGVKVVVPPTPVTVGGVEGEQLDILTGPEGVGVGPIEGTHLGNGFPQNAAVRIIVVNVDGRDVQISFAADEEGSKHFDEAVLFAQPLVDSMTWI